MKNDSEDVSVQSMPSYEVAMDALTSLITRQKRGGQSSLQCRYTKLEMMSMYLKILGFEEDINKLKIIHVAGTKGKGSTCIFCEAILRKCGFTTGVFISPHLIDVTERFRLNGMEISEEKFLRYFWSCWKQLEENITDQLPMPPLFQFLTLLAFKIFVCEKVDVAIVEVGLGGKEDATNVIKQPVVCAITSLGMDHTETLGDTIGLIASHKAGIFKPKVPAFTAPQPPEAMNVILKKASELKVPLNVVAPLDCRLLKGLKLSLCGDHQILNAGLAVSLCRCWLERTGKWKSSFQNEQNLPEEFVKGLSTAHLSGRGQIFYDASLKRDYSAKVSGESCGDLIFYLDGAHSPESIEACAKWFSSEIKGDKISLSALQVKSAQETQYNHDLYESKILADSAKFCKQILLFNCSDLRDPMVLLPQLHATCASSGTFFSKALFVPSMSKYTKVTSAASGIPADHISGDLSWQLNLQRIWENILHGREFTAADEDLKITSVTTVPATEFLYKDVSHCSPSHNSFKCTAVLPSLPLTIKWLRDCVKGNPSLTVQVSVIQTLFFLAFLLIYKFTSIIA